MTVFYNMVERQGFEPWELLHSMVFKTTAFGHSATSPKLILLFYLRCFNIVASSCLTEREPNYTEVFFCINRKYLFLVIFSLSSMELCAFVIKRSDSCILTVLSRHEQATERALIESSSDKSAKVSVADISQRVFKCFNK